MSPPPHKLHVDDLRLTYRNAQTGRLTAALEGVRFAVRDREFVSIVGPSGCGKTTLLSCLAGLIAPTSGTIQMDGVAVSGAHPSRAMVFQSPTLLPWATVRRNVAYGLALQGKTGIEHATRVADLVKLVGLEGFEDHYPHELSGGMQQRVNLARALAVEPDVLLMDEPFAALDAQTRDVMQTELLRVWEHERRTVIFVTHQIEEAVYLSDRVIVMSRRPAAVQASVPIEIERPRHVTLKRTPAFHAYVDGIWDMITSRDDPAEAAAPPPP
jgi:NitT/TauT family transport system ATP-binding protein